MIEDLISNAAHSAFRRPGFYTPPGAGAVSVEVEVIVDLAVDVFSEYGEIVARVDTADFRLDEVDPDKGGTLSSVEGHDGIEWVITKRAEDDGILVTMHMGRK